VDLVGFVRCSSAEPHSIVDLVGLLRCTSAEPSKKVLAVELQLTGQDFFIGCLESRKIRQLSLLDEKYDKRQNAKDDCRKR
jgi:hypothetical protein